MKSPGTVTSFMTLRKRAWVVPCHLTFSSSSIKCLSTSFTLYFLSQLSCSFCTFSFFFSVVFVGVVWVVPAVCKHNNEKYSQFLPCNSPRHYIPTGPPGFPFSSTLQWTQSPCRMFNDFFKRLNKVIATTVLLSQRTEKNKYAV